MTSTDAMGDDATIAGDAPVRRDDEEVIAQGAVVGRYLVLGRVGAGGMGVVHAAYDPELDRKVALKVLHASPGGSHSTEGRTRLIREAQALAKLSHPNVVAVFDVGTVAERVWMTMEFVKGQTLGAWLEQQPRPWPQVLQVMSAAGEGLAAAHEGGLLHRDFKPDNVMIDTSGRVRVMDFGLARAGTHAPAGGRTITGLTARSEPSSLSMRVTRVGSLMGTPGYMSPEQIGGDQIDARSDQFAFCVTLWEALYGQRPFGGLSLPELLTHVLEGERQPPPAGVAVPGWLRRVCERGMATDPSQRFESMRALLFALGRGRVRARRRLWLAGVGALVAVAAGALGVQRWDRARLLAACEAEGASIEQVWNDEARARLRAALVASRASHAETTADKVLPWLDRQARAWAEHQALVCRNETVDGRWHATIVGRARWCLEEHRLALESIVGVLSTADDGVVQRAVMAVAALDSSAACVDPDALGRALDPPASELRPRIAAARSALAHVGALSQAGKHQEGLQALEEIRDELRALEWTPLQARASALESALHEGLGSFARAEEAGIAAYLAAAEGTAWTHAANVAERLVVLVGQAQARPAEGRLWAEHAEMAAALAGDPLGLHEADRLQALAGIAFSTGAHEQARGHYERALELQRAAVGRDHPAVGRLLVNLGAVAWSMGSNDEARDAFEQALAILEDALGPDHPDLAIVLGNLGALHFEAEDYARTKVLYERALEINAAALPPGHPEIAASLDNLALVLDALGDHDEALALQQQAIAAWERAVGPEHPSLAVSYGNLTRILRAMGRSTEALAAYEHALDIYDRHEGAQQYEHDTRFGFAQLLVQTGGDRARARALAEQAAQGYRELGEGKADALAEVEAWLAEQGSGEPAVEPPLHAP